MAGAAPSSMCGLRLVPILKSSFVALQHTQSCSFPIGFRESGRLFLILVCFLKQTWPSRNTSLSPPSTSVCPPTKTYYFTYHNAAQLPYPSARADDLLHPGTRFDKRPSGSGPRQAPHRGPWLEVLFCSYIRTLHGGALSLMLFVKTLTLLYR
jgi:hypothetical protein